MKNKLVLLMAIALLSFRLTSAQHQWVTQNSGTSAYLTSVFFVSADTGYVCGDPANVLKTVNGGTTWNQVGTGPRNCLFFLNEQKGFGTDGTQILSTQNGGANWNSCYSNPNVSDIWDMYFSDKKNGYAIAWSPDMENYVIKTNNGGVLWDTIYKYSQNFSFFSSIFFKDSLNGYVGCNNGYILKTTDGGFTWNPILVETDVSFNSIYFPTIDTGYAAIDAGVYKTIDGGDTWDELASSFSSILYSIYFTDANHGFVAGGNGFSSMTLYQTTDGGNSWTQSASGVQTLSEVFFVDTMPGYAVGSNGTILKYTNTTGIMDYISDEINMNFYPNPATEYLNIKTKQKSLIEILNLEGQIIKSIKNDANETRIDLMNLSRGIYLIKATSDKGIAVKKFIKE